MNESDVDSPDEFDLFADRWNTKHIQPNNIIDQHSIDKYRSWKIWEDFKEVTELDRKKRRLMENESDINLSAFFYQTDDYHRCHLPDKDRDSVARISPSIRMKIQRLNWIKLKLYACGDMSDRGNWIINSRFWLHRFSSFHTLCRGPNDSGLIRGYKLDCDLEETYQYDIRGREKRDKNGSIYVFSPPLLTNMNRLIGLQQDYLHFNDISKGAPNAFENWMNNVVVNATCPFDWEESGWNFNLRIDQNLNDIRNMHNGWNSLERIPQKDNVSRRQWRKMKRNERVDALYLYDSESTGMWLNVFFKKGEEKKAIRSIRSRIEYLYNVIQAHNKEHIHPSYLLPWTAMFTLSSNVYLLPKGGYYVRRFKIDDELESVYLYDLNERKTVTETLLKRGLLHPASSTLRWDDNQKILLYASTQQAGLGCFARTPDQTALKTAHLKWLRMLH